MAERTLKKNPNNFVVTQHNNLVEANYSSNLTARSLKVARLLVSTISPTDEKLGSCEMDIKSLKRFLGYKEGTTWGRFHADLKDIAKRLNKEPIEIGISKGKTLVAFFLSSYTIDIPKGKVSFDISPKLKPFLLELKKNYTSYLLINIPKLKSGYSIRLYELLHQYRKIGKRSFKIEDLQKKVGSNYSKYSHFKDKVIHQAQRDLEKHTDLAFIFDTIKEGRKVVGIQFIIFGNTPKKEYPNQLSLLEEAIEIPKNNTKPALPEILVQTLNNLGINDKNIVKYLAKGFDIIEDEKRREIAQKRCETLGDYYLEKLEMTKNSASSKDNAAGFFVKALKEDWATSKTVQKHKTNEAVLKREKVRATLSKLKRQLDKLTDEKKAKKRAIVEQLDDEVFESAYKATMGSLGDLIRSHVSSVKHLPIRQQYADRMSIHSGVNIHLQEKYPEKFTSLQPIEEKIQRTEKAIADLE